MKRALPFLAALVGVAVLLLVLPLYKPAQPSGVRITRSEARSIADVAARSVGIPVDSTWSTETWSPSAILEKELERHPRRAAAWDDPVIGPRMNVYRFSYYHEGKEKYPAHGTVQVSGQTGEVTGARLRLRAEDALGSPSQEQLRAKADAFVRGRTFVGAPTPAFESARPNEMRGRTDWVFRYRVPSQFPIDKVVLYLNVHFAGTRFAGWDLSEEYADGRQFFGDSGGELAGVLIQFLVMFVMLLILLVIFLRKYHAGEVGVSASSFLFVVILSLGVIGSLMARSSASEMTALGSVSASTTSWAVMAFRLLLATVPMAVVLFLAWAVGESFARERWSERLASFEAILRRDPLNATVGRSILCGSLLAPVIAAAALGVGAIPLLTGHATAGLGSGTISVLFLSGPLFLIVRAASDALLVSIGGILFFLAWSHRRNLLWLGIIATVVLGVIAGTTPPPVDPFALRLLFGFGGIAAAVAMFLAWDLLTATTALFGGTLLTMALPLLSVARGSVAQDLWLTIVVPLVLLTAFAVAALMTRREVLYTHADLAPHVRRIIERERVKAEIDAANRIQAALLPVHAPRLPGASFSSHYRAATEIGGDYFDFLEQPGGEIGIAFGDVSGHGLTSGIVMSMAKSALLVQVGYDSSPKAVLTVLNDIVIRTAPKRILMTFFFGLLDPATNTLRFASAGHHDPYVYRAGSRRLEPLSSWGFPLGVRRREPFREHSVEFAAGDRLVLYSDGLIEAVDDDGEPFGFDRFEETILSSGLQSADEIKKSLLGAVRKFTRNRPPEDDQTLVVIAFDEPATEILRFRERFAASASAETVH